MVRTSGPAIADRGGAMSVMEKVVWVVDSSMFLMLALTAFAVVPA